MDTKLAITENDLASTTLLYFLESYKQHYKIRENYAKCKLSPLNLPLRKCLKGVPW